MRRIYRVEEDKVVDGVCGGIAEYFDIDPVIVLCWQSVPVKMRVIGKHHHLRHHQVIGLPEIDHGKIRMAHVEMHAKLGIRYVHQDAEEREPEALMRKERDPFLVRE